jgi:hypothetical protein
MFRKKKEIFLNVGDTIPLDNMTTVNGETFNLKNEKDGIIHIYFGRYSGCV